MEFIEYLEENLAVVAEIAKLFLEGFSVLFVILGTLKAVQLILRLRRRYRHSDDFPFNQVRLRFGSWLALALECQLGADILATTVAPTFEILGKLAVVALVRTFLNYFLNKEIEAEIEQENMRREKEAV
ncbi:MAG: DUF1622 domain-containing protein [Elainellaceae cyanobacterium]